MKIYYFLIIKPLEEHRFKRPVNDIYKGKTNHDIKNKGSNKSVAISNVIKILCLIFIICLI